MGYHFHFVNSNRDAGGHVLQCQPSNVIIKIDHTDQWQTVLPEDDAFYNADLNSN